MPPPMCMANSRVRLAVIFLALLLPPVHGHASTSLETDDSGKLLDVRIFSASCLHSTTCELVKPSHFVEYFSADWCEPCEQVSAQLRNQSENDTFILQHHASPIDYTFLSSSKLRFDEVFRLLFIPSVVVDGQYLVTGTRQAMDLPELLKNSSKNWTGLESLSLDNGELSWNASLAGQIRIWYVEPTTHEFTAEIHQTLARKLIQGNSSELQQNLSEISTTEAGYFVIMLEQEGPYTLTSGSLAPTGRMEFIENPSTQNPQNVNLFSESWFIALLTMALIFTIMPAISLHRTLMKSKHGAKVEKRVGEE